MKNENATNAMVFKNVVKCVKIPTGIRDSDAIWQNGRGFKSRGWLRRGCNPQEKPVYIVLFVI